VIIERERSRSIFSIYQLIVDELEDSIDRRVGAVFCARVDVGPKVCQQVDIMKLACFLEGSH
jgi:hypothetical protein